jgi:hypothetical protein
MAKRFCKLQILVDGQWIDDSCTFPSQIAAIFDACMRGWQSGEYRVVQL